MMIKCKVCGCEFPAVADKRYTVRDNTKTSVVTFAQDEEKLYDAFDCPMCGCQAVVQERKREYCGELGDELEGMFDDE